MLTAIKIGSIVVALIVLLRLKLNLCLTLFLLSVYTVVLFQVNLESALVSAGNILVDERTVDLYIIIGVVIYIAAIQKSRKMFDRLVSALDSIFRDSRVVALVSPAIVGFLPMPGGALVSAPLVDISTQKLNLEPEFKTFINYWFRHIWEYVWPIYASLLIFATLSHIPLKTVILYQAPFAFLQVLLGLVVVFHYFKRKNIKCHKPKTRTSFKMTALDLFEGVWPIILVIILFFILSIPLAISLTATALLLTLVKKVKPGEILATLFSKISLNALFLIASIMVFKEILQVSNAFANLGNINVPVHMIILICFLVSFIMGFLTGLNNAFIAIAYPILLPLIQSLPHSHVVYLSIYIYVIGFTGILLSPIHLCLVLTNEYFKSTLYKVYKYLAPPAIIMAIVASIIVVLLVKT